MAFTRAAEQVQNLVPVPVTVTAPAPDRSAAHLFLFRVFQNTPMCSRDSTSFVTFPFITPVDGS
jgi:hypothetical protein